MDELIKELDGMLAKRKLTDVMGSVDEDTVRLMELRMSITNGKRLENLSQNVRDLSQMVRAKF